ncbi:MAG TPA: B12-binding domain-containing radical SAM protein, partial [Polyangiaceae bacterium]|nr:B12-binding domain-containing radical SAM protein [Polyangiaceae bacterium]
DEYVPTANDLREVVLRLGEAYAPALLDLAEALIEGNELSEASEVLDTAERLQHPLPGLVHNARACLFAKRGAYEQLKNELVRAARIDPQHYVLLRNAREAKRWFDVGGPASGTLPDLRVRHDFELFERTEQPALPGPIPLEWLGWQRANPVTLLPSELAAGVAAGPSTPG